MKVIPFSRRARSDSFHAAAACATIPFPAQLALSVRATLCFPAVTLQPLRSPWASVLLAPAFAHTAGLRLVAQEDIFLAIRPEPPPLTKAKLLAVTVLARLFLEARSFHDFAAALAGLDYRIARAQWRNLEAAEHANFICQLPFERSNGPIIARDQRAPRS